MKRAALGLILVALAWATVTAVLFAMWWSALIGLAAMALCGWHRERLLAIFGIALVVSPLVFLQVSLPELAEELDSIAGDARAAQDADEEAGPVLLGRQRLAVRWLNAHMAAGGWLLGLREVAWETMQLDLQASPEYASAVRERPIRERRRLCRGNAADPEVVVRRDSDFPMDSAEVRRAVAKLARSTRDGQHRWETLDLRGGYARHPWHVVLALWVPDARIHAKRSGDQLELWYRGSIQYPLHTIGSVTAPRPIGERSRLVADEAIFCALQMDGDFRPYVVEWHWTMARSDAQNLTETNERRLFERVARGW